MSAEGKDGRGSNDALVQKLLEKAVEFCCEGDLPLARLEEMIECLPRDAIQKSPLLHHACMNPGVTLEIVRLLLDRCPKAAEMACAYSNYGKLEVATDNDAGRAYPIHLACSNSHCPSSIIELLVEKNQSALEHCSGFLAEHAYGYVIIGLPLHYYLARSSNIDIHAVKVIVESHPDALVTALNHDYSDADFTPLHVFMKNENVDEGMVDVLRYLVETNPECLQMHCLYDGEYIFSPGGTPLHIACANKNVSPAMVQFILDNWEDSTHQQNLDGYLPIHILCDNKNLGEEASLEILDVLLSSHPDSVQNADNDPSYCPIHVAAFCKSVSFCKRLVQAHPESVKTGDENGELPIHFACTAGRLDTVEYLLDLYPDSVNVAIPPWRAVVVGEHTLLLDSHRGGYLPIHCAAGDPDYEGLPISPCYTEDNLYGPQTTKVIEFLLLREPNIVSKATTDGSLLPLHLICDTLKSNLDATKLLFNADPDAILAKNDSGMTPLDIAGKYLSWKPSHSTTVSFLEGELVHAHQAQNAETMMKRDGNGWLPIHRALQNNASLGAIKLLYRGNPSALSVVDNVLASPIHIACKSCPVETVKFLLDQDDKGLKVCDVNGNLPLHYACRGVNCGVIKYLAGRHPASVEKRNGRNKLPLHLLCENGCVSHTSPEYIEAVWILIRAKPEALLG